MAEALTLTQQRARARANRGQQMITLAKDDVGEALEAFSAIRGFSRHYARLEKLHDEFRKLEKKIRAAVGRPLDLTAQAKKEEQEKARKLAARVREQQQLHKRGTSSTPARKQRERERHQRLHVARKGAFRG